MLSTAVAAQLPSCCYCIPSHLNVHHHAQQKRKLTTLSLANADSQISLRNFYGLTLLKTHNCSKWQEGNNRARYNSNSNQNHKHLFFLQFFPITDSKETTNQNPKTRNQDQHQLDEPRELKEKKEDRVLFSNMWWVDVKAAFGQRINLEGILCSTMVILKDPKLALPHISVPDIRYIDWGELRKKGFKGVVFDKDNTITAPYSLTPWPPLESSLECCKLEFGPDLAVFSNSAGLYEYDHDGSKARMLEGAIGIKVIRHRVKKPAGTAEEIEKHFGCESSQLIMVGDRPFTDVVYGNRNGFLTILTEPLSLAEEPFIVQQVRKLENSFVTYWSRRGLKPLDHKSLPDPMPCVKEPRPR
ncbi:phosphatidylglycerophosphate phosphatase 1, chloroplastic/mitochondrial-like [Gastrolobium bilobum]|uniref:phosphatidylglycerophosphate phosphatase 1, chloroplastic/mitochondrial-like n=1 Tax=Gastrolobium bilobum TaxID=150636 RepID=UPI002AAFF908|nr:phosphatidylglycerophosphate phosphatase 1, chloroplastic/mitochondrial-like [Gastrolobium bilobum]